MVCGVCVLPIVFILLHVARMAIAIAVFSALFPLPHPSQTLSREASRCPATIAELSILAFPLSAEEYYDKGRRQGKDKEKIPSGAGCARRVFCGIYTLYSWGNPAWQTAPKPLNATGY